MNKSNTISVVIASDNFFAVLVAALLKSIEVHHKTHEHIDVHIIDDGISLRNRKKLMEVVDSDRISLIWHKSKDVIPSHLSIPIDTSGLPLTTYLRIFSPYLINHEVEKLIYLDVDIILEDDISKLWHMPLDDKAVGAVQDLTLTVDCEWAGLPNYRELGLDPKTKYFNAGVLLIDPIRWRLDNKSEEMVSSLIKYKQHVRFGDQYILNVVFANKWQELDPKWNWFATKEDVGASLIHFTGTKPVFSSYNSNPIFQRRFLRYLEPTPWRSFTPINGSRRVIRKGYNIIKKNIFRLLSSY